MKEIGKVCMTLSFTLSIIRWGSRVKWSNPGKGVAPSSTRQCRSYRKGSLRVITVICLIVLSSTGLFLELNNPPRLICRKRKQTIEKKINLVDWVINSFCFAKAVIKHFNRKLTWWKGAFTGHSYFYHERVRIII